MSAKQKGMSSESESETEDRLLKPEKGKKKTANRATKGNVESAKETSTSKPTTKVMVNKALTELKNRKGTSLYAIKKYLEETYKINSEKLNPHIKRYIKMSVENGTIIQTKGTGASGSFKLVIKEKKVGTNFEKRKPEAEKESRRKEEKKKQRNEDPEGIVVTHSSRVNKDPQKIEEEKNRATKMKKAKFAKRLKKTPSKIKSMAAKRKSLGTIIKPPKMKPLTPQKMKTIKKK